MPEHTTFFRSAWIRTAAAVGVFALLTLVNTWPVATRPGAVIGQHGDAFFSVWRLAWVAHQLVADPLHLFDANIFYPEPRTLAYSDAMLLPATLLAPVQWMGAPPIVVYNAFLLSTFVLNGVAAYVLVYRLVGSYVAGLLAGVIFAFSPYRFEHFDHLEMQLSFWIPLAVLAWHRAVERQATRDCLIVAVMVSAQVLSCIYYAVFLITSLGVMTACWFWRTPMKAVRAAALMLIPAITVFAFYSLPYLGNRDRVGDRPAGQIAGYSAMPIDFVSAPATNRLYGWTARFGAPERHLFPGLVAGGLLVVGLWPPLDRRRAVHAAALALSFQLALGSNGLIYDLLYAWVLPYRGLRVPARADVLILLGTAVLAGYGLTRLGARMGRWRAAPAVLMLVVSLASIEYLSKPVVREVDQRVSSWYAMLPTMPDAVVFEWPVTVPWRLGTMVDLKYMYRSTLHWRPLLNGYSGFYPRSYIALLIAMRSFPDSRSIEHLQSMGATVLVVHDPQHGTDEYERALERLARDPKVQVIGSGVDAGARVAFFRLAPGPGPRRAHPRALRPADGPGPL
jgi:hypothetical protein